MVGLLLLLFIAVPILEIYVIIRVGQEIGALWTIALLVADSVLGTMLLRSQGRAAWRRVVEALRSGRAPAREAFDGALVVLGGALLLAPGFVTDVAGLLLLLPPTRALARRLLARRFAVGVVGPAFGAPGHRGGAPPYDVEGTATEVAGERPPLPDSRRST